MSEIIPFGKYKGQPIEVLQGDPQYVDWLKQQDWFRERYPSIVNIVINNFGEPEETPEHNRLQIRFLDEEFRLKLAWMISRNRIFGYLTSAIENATDWKSSDELISAKKVVFEKNAIDCQFEAVFRFGMPFTDRGHPDTYCSVAYEMLVRVEIKPTISDDYPAILRQMHAMPKHSGSSDVLVYENFSGSIAENQLREFFEASGMHAASIQEIEKTSAPKSREDFISQFFEFQKNRNALNQEKLIEFCNHFAMPRPGGA